MIRALREDEVTFELSAEQDDLCVRDAIASGDGDFDLKVENEILARLDRGDVWAWACVTVTARWKHYRGHDCLGACSYESEADFVTCDYYKDMKRAALADLNADLQAYAVDLFELQEES